MFGFSGHSSGGHMAALLALDARYLARVGVPLSAIKVQCSSSLCRFLDFSSDQGVIPLSGVFSLTNPLAEDENNWRNKVFR